MHSGSLEWIRKTGLSARAGLAPGDAFGAIALPFLNQPPTARAGAARVYTQYCTSLYALAQTPQPAFIQYSTSQWSLGKSAWVWATAHASRYLEIA